VVLQHLRDIRSYELHRAVSLIPSQSKILEVGAGAGWQAKTLAENGFSVVAIDVPGTQYAQERSWPVLEYDGINLPFSDGCFDVVFSSHVLEHIPHAEGFQAEVRRVLKPDGIAIHILPSGTWRLWTSICLYGYLAKILVEVLFPVLPSGDLAKTGACLQKRSVGRNIQLRALLPSRHGEAGNAISEIYLFSRYRWMNLFRRTGWSVEAYYPIRLFYTGYMLLNSKLSLRRRHNASFILGSSSHLFCLRKADARF
jgi:SAM-dependent methyltransferase